MDDLEQQYLTIVERVRGYPMSEAARTAILAEIEAACRRAGVRQEASQRNSTSSR